MPGVKKPAVRKPIFLDQAWERSLGDGVEALAWSPRGEALAAVSVSGTLALLAPSGREAARVAAHGLGASSLAWHPDGDLLATGGLDGRVRLWDPRGKEFLNVSPAGQGWIGKVAWDPRGRSLAFSSGRGVGFWVRETGALSLSAPNPSTVTDLAWNLEGTAVAASCYGGARIFRPGVPETIREYPWKGSSLALARSPDGRYLAAGQQDQEVHLWETATGKDMHMHGYPLKVRELSWSADGRFLATGGGDTVTVWDCSGKGPSGTRPLNLEGHEDRISCLAFHPAARGILASGGADARVAIWDLARGQVVATALADGPVTCLAWGGPRLAVGDAEGKLLAFNAPF